MFVISIDEKQYIILLDYAYKNIKTKNYSLLSSL